MPPKKWSKRYLSLPTRQRRFINNFMGTRSGNDQQDYANWASDCISYGYDKLRTYYWEIKGLYDIAGPLPIPEEVRALP